MDDLKRFQRFQMKIANDQLNGFCFDFNGETVVVLNDQRQRQDSAPQHVFPIKHL